MKFEKLSCAILALCFFSQPATAQGPAPLKIGYVDFNIVVSRSPQFEVAMKALDQEFNARKKTIRDKEIAVSQLQEKLQKEARANTMTPEALRKLDDQIVTQDREVRWQKSIL